MYNLLRPFASPVPRFDASQLAIVPVGYVITHLTPLPSFFHANALRVHRAFRVEYR